MKGQAGPAWGDWAREGQLARGGRMTSGLGEGGSWVSGELSEREALAIRGKVPLLLTFVKGPQNFWVRSSGSLSFSEIYASVLNLSD